MVTELKVGDKLWYVESGPRGRGGREVTVEKIGRLYVTVSNGERFAKGDWRSGWGSYHRSAEEYETAQRLTGLWSDFLRKIERKDRPAHLDEAAIRKIAEQCGVTLP